MEVNYTILEKIRQYYSEELSESESREMEHLLDTDGRYVFHDKLFRATNRGIRAATNVKNKDWIRELEQSISLEDTDNLLAKLGKKDKKTTAIKRSIILLVAAVLLPALVYVLWPDNTMPGTNKPFGPSGSEVPIAKDNNDNDDEPLIGSSGAAIEVEAPIFEAKIIDNTLVYGQPQDGKRKFLVRKSGQPGMSYMISDGNLTIFSDDTDIFTKSVTRWLQVTEAGQQKNFIKIDDRIYEIDLTSTQKMPLTPAPYRDE